MDTKNTNKQQRTLQRCAVAKCADSAMTSNDSGRMSHGCIWAIVVVRVWDFLLQGLVLASRMNERGFYEEA